jgi:tetratricopeptide (TPR) repeat protein
MSDSDLSHGDTTPEETTPEVEATEVVRDTETAEAAAPKRRKSSMFDDPMVRVMSWIAIGLVVLFLSGILGALMFGLVGNKAPRTAVERRVNELQGLLVTNPKDPEIHAKYILVLVSAGRYSEANDAINKAMKVVDQSAGADITIAKAKLLLAKKDYKGALATVAEAKKIIQKNYDAEIKSTKLPNPSKAFGMNKNYGEAALVAAHVYVAQGDWENAVKEYNEFLKLDPLASDILIERGNAYLQLGKTAEAKADFETALKFDPTNEAALAGIKKIGEGQ